MFVILGILSVLIAAALIFAVVIQNSKGGGLSSTFGGASGATQMLGVRRSNEAIEKLTWYLAGALAVIAFLANVVGMSSGDAEAQLRVGQAIEEGAYVDEQATEVLDPSQYVAPVETPAPAETEE